jgi:hypothetical protein
VDRDELGLAEGLRQETKTTVKWAREVNPPVSKLIAVLFTTFADGKTRNRIKGAAAR